MMLYQKGWSSILPPVLHISPWLPLGCVAMPGTAAGSSFGVFVPIVLNSCHELFLISKASRLRLHVPISKSHTLLLERDSPYA